MGYVTSVLLRWLRRELAENEVAVLIPSGSDRPGFGTHLEAPGVPFPLWEQIVVPATCRRLRARLLLSPYNTAPLCIPRGTRSVLVVHDLIFLESSANLIWSALPRQNLGRVYRRLVVPSAIRRADQLLTISRHTADQLRSRFGPAADGAHVLKLPPRVGESERTTAVRLARRYGAVQPYLLHIGGDAPHKATATVVRAFRNLPTESLGAHLVILGVRQPKKVVPGESEPAGVHFLPFVPEEHLAGLYAHARALVMASTHEGLGLPVQEALVLGTPVVCSAIPSFRELAGAAALYVEPRDEAALARAMLRLLLDDRLHGELASRAEERGRQLNNAAGADPFLRLIRELLDAPA